MSKKDDINNNLFDEIDDNEEEIKEEIIIDNNADEEYINENKKNVNFINTYDKFLIDSIAMDGQVNHNEYHYILKNQMFNIIDDIKKKENEKQENKNNIKKKIFEDMANKFINGNKEKKYKKDNIDKSENNNLNNYYSNKDKKEENEVNGISYKDNNTKKININQYTLNPNQCQNINNNQNYYNQNSNDNIYMENIQDLDKTNSQDNYIEENNHENIIENENKDNFILKGNEKNKSIDINLKKNRGYLNNPKDVTESKEYNINIDDFLKENTMNEEDVVNNATNLIIDNSENGHNFNNNKKIIDNKSIKYAVVGNPELKQKINDNYDYFSQKNKNTVPINQQLTAKFNVLATREAYYKNNNDENKGNIKNYDKKSEMIYIDDCQTEEERKAKQKKFEERKQKKLKELEEKINHKRANSKPKPVYNNNESIKRNNINDKQINFNSNKKENNNPIELRPRTSKSKPMTYINNQNKNEHVSINAINKDETQTINNEYNNKGSKVTKNKKNLRPMSMKSNNISHINKNNNTTLMSNNTSHYSTLSRVPIKIEREESKIANKKVKNVHYSKMSNKKIIKKAINEVCLAGNSNKEYRDKINEIIDKCEFENYIILFRGNYGRFDIKAIYTYDIQNKNIEILTCIGNAPNFIDSSMVATFYKYNISANQFKELRGTKEFSCIVDGVCLRK